MNISDEKLSRLRKWKEKNTFGKKEKITKATYSIVSGSAARSAVCAVKDNPLLLSRYVNGKQRVVVISDGSDVKGMGAVDYRAVLPIVEGSATVLESLGGIEVVPIVTSDIVLSLQILSDSFGVALIHSVQAKKNEAIKELAKRVAILPVLHAGRDGMAIAILAALINAHKVCKKSIHTARVAILGIGAEGVGIAQLLLYFGVGDIVLVDRNGILSSARTNTLGEKATLVEQTNRERRSGGVLEAVVGADVLISTVGSYIPYEEYVRMMSQQPIVLVTHSFPKGITAEQLYAVGASVVLQGDVNESNCVHEDMVLPALLRGIVEHEIRTVGNALRVRVAKALAETIPNPTKNKILPTVFDKRKKSKIIHACS